MMHSALNYLGVASLIGFLSASLPSAQVSQTSRLAWPDAFTATGTSEEPAQQHVLDLVGLRVKLTLPQSWVVRPDGSNGASIAIELVNGRRLEIAETKPNDFNFNAPVTAERLAESIKTMQANVPAGYVVEKAGQVKIGDRLWLWHESQIPTFDTSTSALYQEMLRGVPYRSARTWSFTTTPHSQLVRVYLAVLLPGNAADTHARTTSAGAIFRRILSSMTFEARK